MAFLRIIDDLDRSLRADAEILTRQKITVWLMQFSAGLPLRLEHPRIGEISYSGIRFAGSVVAVFDRFVSLCIEDFTEKHVKQIEAAMVDEDPAQLQQIALQATARIASARQALRDQAATTKARLLGLPPGGPDRAPVSRQGAEPVIIAARLNARLIELQKKIPEKDPLPVWKWLEQFARSNRALGYLLTFLAGVAITILGMILKH